MIIIYLENEQGFSTCFAMSLFNCDRNNERETVLRARLMKKPAQGTKKSDSTKKPQRKGMKKKTIEQ